MESEFSNKNVVANDKVLTREDISRGMPEYTVLYYVFSNNQNELEKLEIGFVDMQYPPAAPPEKMVICELDFKLVEKLDAKKKFFNFLCTCYIYKLIKI